MQHSTIMNRIEKAGILRPVKTVEMFMPNGEVVPNKKAIVNADDESFVSVVGGAYNVIQNEEVFDRVATSLLKSNLDLTGLDVAADTSATCARQIVSFKLPAHQIETSKNDTTQMQIVVRNSLDGTWMFRTDVGGFRIACANGQVYGDFTNAYANRHTKNFNIEALLDGIVASSEIFTNLGLEWARLANIDLTRDQAVDFFLQFLGKKLKDKDQLLGSDRAATVHEVLGLWDDYSEEMGSTAYAAYNVMTDYASHVGEKKSIADVIDVRQKQVIKALDLFKEAA